MKKVVSLLTVLALLCGLCGCNVTPNPQKNPVGDKTAFTRRFVSVPHEISASAALTAEDTLTVLDKHTKDNNTWTAALSQFDLTNRSERALYTATYVYGTDPEPVDVCWDGKDTVWVTLHQEGNLMFGGTTPDGYLLQAINITDGNIRYEWNLTNLLGGQVDCLLHAAQDNTAYLITEHAGEEEHRFSVTLANAATGTISDRYLLEDIAALPTPITLGDGRVAALSAETNTLYPFAKGTVTPETPLTLSEDLPDGRFFSGGDNENFLYLAGQTLYGAEGNLLVDFSQWGVNFTDDTLRDITLTDGVYRVLLYEDSAFGVYTLTPCAADEAAPTLQVAGYFVGDGIHAAVTAFNRLRSDYTARVIDYRQYDDDPNSSKLGGAGVTKLNTELLAGGDFDVLYLNEYLSSAALAKQGALLDLYPLLDADSEITRDTFVPRILEKAETDGHLYSLSTAFGIRTMLSDRRVIGEYSALSVADWHSLQAAHPQATVTDLSEEKFLNYLSNIVPHDFIANNTAQLDTDTFVEYLRTMATLESADEKMAHLTEDRPVADFAGIKSGQFLLMPFYLRNFSFYQRALCNLADGTQFTGYPTENGAGHTLEFADTLGILSTSDQKEAAWTFLKLAVKENRLGMAEGELESPGFPTDRSSFEAQLAYYLDAKNFINTDGTAATTFEGAPLRALNEVDIERLYAIIAAAKPLVQTDRAVTDILADETAYFLKGEATAVDTAARIQQRIQLYLNEQQ